MRCSDLTARQVSRIFIKRFPCCQSHPFEILNKKGSVGCLSVVTFCLLASGGSFCTGLGVFLVEFFNAASGIHNFLRAGIKRMAFRTDFHTQRLDRCGSGCELVATAASNGNLVVLWMDVGFHFSSLLKIGVACPTHAQGRELSIKDAFFARTMLLQQKVLRLKFETATIQTGYPLIN